jgi:hypothetical protein
MTCQPAQSTTDPEHRAAVLAARQVLEQMREHLRRLEAGEVSAAGFETFLTCFMQTNYLSHKRAALAAAERRAWELWAAEQSLGGMLNNSARPELMSSV